MEHNVIYSGNTRYKLYSGSSRMGVAKENVLPYDAEVEYIQSSNLQYIDTGFKPNQDTAVQMSILIPTSNVISRFFETRNGTWNSEFALMNFGQRDNQFQARYGTITNGTKLIDKLAVDTVYTLYMNKQLVYLDGSLLKDLGAKTFQCNYNLILFGLNSAGTITTGDSIYRLFWCKIWDNDTLIRDYIPVRVGQKGCLYDKISGKLFYNQGTADFILGNDIN